MTSVSFKPSQDPLALFSSFFDQAKSSQIPFYDAIALATASVDAKPSVRMVLYKGLYEGKFLFFTHYESRKGKELSENPWASAVFFWHEIECQIRIEGRVQKSPASLSDTYWKTRPRKSQISGTASKQSQVLSERGLLLREVERLTKSYEGKEIPRPENWGGFELTPDSIEFWIGKPNRLHERYLYVRNAKGWKFAELSP